mgnify:CR=1 FL=1
MEVLHLHEGVCAVLRPPSLLGVLAGCLVMPQAILFIVCLVVELVLLYPTLLWVLVECGDTSYYSRNFFSTSGTCCPAL